MKKAEPLLTPPCKIGCNAISGLPSHLAGAAFSGHHAADALAEQERAWVLAEHWVDALVQVLAQVEPGVVE